MVALPGQLFYNTQIPACLWFLTRNKKHSKFRSHSGETLFIDARKMGVLIDRVHRELTEEDIARIAQTYNAWRGEKNRSAGILPAYADIPGFCKSAKLDEILAHGYVLTPGRYVGAEEAKDDQDLFEEQMQQLVPKLEEQFAQSAKLEIEIRQSLKGLIYEN